MDLIPYILAKKYTDKQILNATLKGADGILTQIKVGGQVIQAADNTVELPAATAEKLGLVKGSEEISINKEGQMTINSVSINKLTQAEDEELILDSSLKL